MKYYIKLTAEQKATLTSWSKALTTQQRYAFRSKIILMLNEGYKYKDIKRELNTNDTAISKWKNGQ